MLRASRWSLEWVARELAVVPGSLKLDKNVVEGLSQPRPLLWLRAALMDWLLILGAVACCLNWSHWYVWGAAIVLIGNRQHALAVLMHEGVHYRITNRRWSNNILSDLLVGYAVFLPTASYRVFHMPHHRYLDTPDDPEGQFLQFFPNDLRFPQHPVRFAWLVLRDLSGLWPVGPVVLARLIWRQPGRHRIHAIPIVLLHSAAAIAAYMAGVLNVYVILWLVPLLTVFAATFRIRGITEHSGIEEAGPLRFSREEPDVLRTTRSIRGFGQHLFGPHAISYHLEHHLYPSVPFYNLPKLSRLLAEQAPAEVGARIRSSYRDAIGECLGRL